VSETLENQKSVAANRLLVFVFTATIFVSATLLFLVQPMFARMVLPLLGGSPAVWNTVLVFFQAALLAGYAYAHASTKLLGIRRQAALHLVVLVLPLFVLPLAIPQTWRPPTEANPVPSLMVLLLLTVGLPFFVISTTSPLLQRWFAGTGHPAAKDPYFLYAASNCGSMLALLSYPLLMEPRLRLMQQSRFWAGGYVVFVFLVATCAILLWRSSAARGATAAEREAASSTQDAAPEHISAVRRLRWIALAFVPSSLMLSVTQYLSTDIAAIPLMWVIPLALYLLTFIFVFSSRSPLKHQFVARATALLMLPLVIVVATRASQPIMLLIPLHLLSFFFITMLCHGELARTRPSAQNLTEFYLWMSVGGVLGGAFNALLAPVVFRTLVEYPLVLAASCLFLPFGKLLADDKRTRVLDWALPFLLGLVTCGLVIGLQDKLDPREFGPLSTAVLFGIPAIICFSFSRRPLRFALGVGAILWAGTFYLSGEGQVLYTERSFFGVHRVTRDRDNKYNLIVHGGIVHGQQSLDPKRRREPMAYYFRTGPIGQMFATFKGDYTKKNIAVVGLGAGGLAAYAQRGENWTFYEIDPVVEYIAREPAYFSYLQDAPANMKVILGDGRLQLEEAPDGAYDLLILDAFSSDALPMHLITREALQLYVRKLSPRGVLVFNTSNLHLELEPVLGNLAKDADLATLFENDTFVDAAMERDMKLGKTPSRWTLMAREKSHFGPLASDNRWRPARTRPDMRVWTDDYSSLLSVFVGNEHEAARRGE
jgi:hypothetical protein